MPRGVYERKPRAAGDAPSATPPQKQKKPRKYTRRARAAAAERFIPTVDVDKRLILVNGGEPQVFTEPQTLAIAQLLFQHYE